MDEHAGSAGKPSAIARFGPDDGLIPHHSRRRNMAISGSPHHIERYPENLEDFSKDPDSLARTISLSDSGGHAFGLVGLSTLPSQRLAGYRLLPFAGQSGWASAHTSEFVSFRKMAGALLV